MLYKIPLVLTPQPEGGFTVTSPLLPELVTEGDTAEEALANVRDALAAVVETYRDLGRQLPRGIEQSAIDGPSGPTIPARRSDVTRLNDRKIQA